MLDFSELTPEEQLKQIHYRDARSSDKYDDIWQGVGKCVFCHLNDKYVFYEENGVVMTISLFAYIDGHFMIVPRRHVRSSKELTQKEWETIRKFSYIAKKLIKKVHGVNGMQIVQKDGAEAQSTVTDHIHFHCIPFDAPDLCQWNYRKLAYTPLENQQLYREEAKKIIGYTKKFDTKYANSNALPLICDLVIINKQGEVLMQDRSADAKLHPDYWTLPGGTVDDFSRSFETELLREVKEEIGLSLKPSDITLVSSQPGKIDRLMHSRHLNTSYPMQARFIWNTYLLQDFDKSTPLKPGDDCAGLQWVELSSAIKHERTSSGMKQTLQLIKDRLHT